MARADVNTDCTRFRPGQVSPSCGWARQPGRQRDRRKKMDHQSATSMTVA